MLRTGIVALVTVPIIVIGACGGSRPAPTTAIAPTSTTTTAAPATTTSTTTPTTVAPATTTDAPTTTKPPPTTPAPTAPPTTNSPPTTAATPAELNGVPSTSGQAIVVHAASYGRSTAALTTYQRAGGGWQVVSGPWTAEIGRAGVAAPGAKREGDGRTPSGTYGFDFAFGIDSNPGVRLPFRSVTGSNIVWDDDPNSPRYNLWVDTKTADAGARPEPMYVRPVYSLGAVIAYNDSRTPGLGSAIFLHVSQGSATSGCVALPAAQLRSALLWLDPAQSPVMVISAGP